MNHEKFETYDRENPTIWKEFETRTIGLINRGKKCGASAILEGMNWDALFAIRNGDTIRCETSRTYAPGYARKFMELHPEYKGFFRTRKALNA